MMSTRKRQAYADAAAALSALRRHKVEIMGNHTIRYLESLTSRCNEAVEYAERTGDWVGARMYAEHQYRWEWVINRPGLVVGAPACDLIACAIS